MSDYQFISSRLGLRKACGDDAPWIYTLNNDPAWLRFIGNRGVHSINDAKKYIALSHEHFDRWGYGLWVVERRHDRQPLGMCGLLNRGIFGCPDLGFAFLAESRGKGYASEAALAVIKRAKSYYQFSYLSAIVHRHNTPSRQLLERLGYRHQGHLFMPNLTRQQLYWRTL